MRHSFIFLLFFILNFWNLNINTRLDIEQNKQFDYESHIFFDDAIQYSNDSKASYSEPNKFAQSLLTTIDQAIT